LSRASRLSLKQWIKRPLDQWPLLQGCVRCLYALIRFLVPTHSRRILFESSPDCADNSLALYEAIQRSPRASEYQLVWLVKNVDGAAQELKREFGTVAPNTRIVWKGSIGGVIELLRSRYVFYTHSCYWFARSCFHQKMVYLGHGIPIKTMGALLAKSGVVFRSRQYSLATSPALAPIIASTFGTVPELILVSGFPRNEWMTCPDEAITRLKGDRNLVVWLPTFRSSGTDGVADDTLPGAPGPLDDLASLDQRLRGKNVLVVIKFHPLDTNNARQWPAFENIKIYSDRAFRDSRLNLYKLLGHASALVTDYSSVAIDFLSLRRPIGIFAPDQSSYIRGFMPQVIDHVSAVCRRLNTIEELANFISAPPPLDAPAESLEFLHSKGLNAPSQTILAAFGLDDLLLPASETASLHVVPLGEAREASLAARGRA
jgi:CDP-glycerol glycerophosphotransferase (TagB/SpsB family)